MENKYFAAQEPKKTAEILLNKANFWFSGLESNGYLDKLRESWAAYHGAYYSNASSGHQITFGGEQGEFAQVAINHFRNIAQHMLVMVTSSRPSLDTKATNTDYKSLIQTRLANGLLEYYMREKRLEKHLKTAVEQAIILGAGYIKLEWNALGGEVHDFNEETNNYIYEGDIVFSNVSPFDVVFDSTKEYSDKHEWVLVRSFKNKFDLAAKYPEFKEQISNLPTKSDLDHYRFGIYLYEDTDDVPVYEFYHKKTESMPEGRYVMFLSSDIILSDSPMPYRHLPVYRISPSDILGSPYGYTVMWDILPIQDAINSLYSTILTNQNAFGVQNLWVPRGVDINVHSLGGGLNVIEGNSQFGKPESMNLTNTPTEVFKFIEMLERAMETISAVNSVARGNVDPKLNSGTAMALVQSMALQFISGLQQSYVQLIEDVGMGLLDTLRDFAAVPRIAAIAGKSNYAKMKEFTGDDLETVNRVIVNVGNPLATSKAGRIQMADNLLQYGTLTAEQYITILDTGSLESATEGKQNELLLIRAENEKLLEGGEIKATAIDRHTLHIQEHKAVLADPELRLDEELTQRTLNHIQEHINLLRETDPALLMLVGEQPLGPVGGSPATPPPPGADINQSAIQEAPMAPMVEPQNPLEAANLPLPEPAQPPPIPQFPG